MGGKVFSGRRSFSLNTCGLLACLSAGALTVSSAGAEESGLGSAGARGARWQQTTVDVNVEASVDELGAGAFDAVIAAATTWQESPGELPTVVVTRGPEDAIGYRRSGGNRNTVRYSVEGDPLANGALAITVITFDAQAKQILDADIVLNGEHAFGFFDEGEMITGIVYDLQNVLTHEMGHFFGLGEQFDDESATMYAYSQAGETLKRDLSGVDLDKISTLYDEAYIPEGGPSCAGATIAGYNGEAWSWAALWLAAFAMVMRRRATRPLVQTGGALLLLVVGAAGPDAPEPVARVLDVDSHWHKGLIVTRLTLQADGEPSPFEATVLGGQVGAIGQQVGRLMPPTRGQWVVQRGGQWLPAAPGKAASGSSM